MSKSSYVTCKYCSKKFNRDEEEYTDGLSSWGEKEMPFGEDN